MSQSMTELLGEGRVMAIVTAAGEIASGRIVLPDRCDTRTILRICPYDEKPTAEEKKMSLMDVGPALHELKAYHEGVEGATLHEHLERYLEAGARLTFDGVGMLAMAGLHNEFVRGIFAGPKDFYPLMKYHAIETINTPCFSAAGNRDTPVEAARRWLWLVEHNRVPEGQEEVPWHYPDLVRDYFST